MEWVVGRTESSDRRSHFFLYEVMGLSSQESESQSCFKFNEMAVTRLALRVGGRTRPGNFADLIWVGPHSKLEMEIVDYV